jgi:8-oxo-dGTP diphosphatase
LGAEPANRDEPTDDRPPVEVAVGILQRASDAAVLLARRPDGKPYAGWWEFPGGKLEAGESVDEALERELHEELGIRITACSVFDAIEFSYPHARVRLHFRLVTDWSGEPRAREGQSLAWQQPAAITVSPLLPASLPVIERLAAACFDDARGLST